MLENGQPRNHKGNLATGKLAHELVAVTVRAIENGKVAPASAGFVDALELGSNPASFVLRSSQFHNANLFAFRFVRTQHFFGKIRADRVLADDLGGDPQNIGS